MKDTTAHSVVFEDLLGKPLVAEFDQPDSSSDGGAILLKACDRKLGLIDAISKCFRKNLEKIWGSPIRLYVSSIRKNIVPNKWAIRI